MKVETDAIKKEQLHRLQLFVLFLLAFVAIAFTGFDAFANGMEAAVKIIKDEAASVVDPLSKLAILLLGIGAIYGRISVTQALVVAVGIVIATDPDGALNLVDGTGGIKKTATNVYDVAGKLVPSLGVLGIIVVGIAAMFGRLSATQAIVVCIGIAIAAGPEEIFRIIKE